MAYNYIKSNDYGRLISNKDDLIYGTKDWADVNGGSDVIRGLGGNDRIYAKFGNDIVDGGLGNDLLNGGVGNDIFYFSSGSGSDTLQDFAYVEGEMDTIVATGNYLGSYQTLLGVQLKFDNDGNGTTDATVLLRNMSKTTWDNLYNSTTTDDNPYNDVLVDGYAGGEVMTVAGAVNVSEQLQFWSTGTAIA